MNTSVPLAAPAAGRKRPLRRWAACLAAAAMVATGLTVAQSVAAPTADATLPSAGSGNRNVTAVMFQWPWTSIGRECTTTLGPDGYGYVLTSPPAETARIGDQWWTSYQPVSYKIDGKLGNRAQFAQMVSDCNAAGVKVMIDAVVNHMSGPPENSTGMAGTPFSYYNYPGLYSDSDFHSCRRDIDWSKNSPDEDRTCQLV
ncbi:MAG TPA: alpha-amylase family glycosyl hydrolase, partial [Steroidobacteraceae bacterium]